MTADDGFTFGQALGYVRAHGVTGADAEELAQIIADGGCVLFDPATDPPIPNDVAARAAATAAGYRPGMTYEQTRDLLMTNSFTRDNAEECARLVVPAQHS